MVLPAISPSFWRPLPPPDSWLLLCAFRGPFVPSTWYILFSPWSPGFCYIVKWQECISDVSSTKMLSLVPFQFVRGRWLSSLLLQLWARFILVLLCLFCCVTEFLCHPPYLTLVSLIFLHFFFNWRKIAVHCCAGFLFFPALVCQGWSQGGGDWPGSAPAVFTLFSTGQVLFWGFHIYC